MRSWKPVFLLMVNLLFAASFVSAAKLESQPVGEIEEISRYIVISSLSHPIRLPLEFMDGATIIGDKGETIIFSKEKHMNVSTVHASDWGNPQIKMNDAPRYIFERDYSDVSDADLKKELGGISRIVLEGSGETILSHLTKGNLDLFIAYNQNRSHIMVSSRTKPDRYTDIVLHGFTREEIDNNIIKGVLQTWRD